MKRLELALLTLVGVFALAATFLLRPDRELTPNIAKATLVAKFKSEEAPGELGRERFRGWADRIADEPLRVHSDGTCFVAGITIDLKAKTYRFMTYGESCDDEYLGRFVYQGGQWRAITCGHVVSCHKGMNRPPAGPPQPDDVR